MSKKISLGVALMLMAMTAAVTVTITMMVSMHLFNLNISDLNKRLALYSKLTYVDELFRSRYIGKLNSTTLGDDTISGYIAGTGDAHAAYYSAAQYQSVNMNLEGKGVGIGVTVVKDSSGNIRVVAVASGSPAARAKVKSGDVIVQVGTQKVTDIGYQKALTLLRGNSGSVAKFTALRAGKKLSFSVTRKQYDTQTVQSKMIGSYGYLRIIEFDANTDTQFKNALQALQKKGAKGLIFDVRDDPGGRLDAAENILDTLLPKGVIVSATYKSGKTKILRYSDAKQVNLPMAVLTNGNTASAAELFTCDLKDYGKAVSVGTKTYGKGTMQETYELSDGSAVSVSVAYFNPAKSKNFNGKGIEPDIAVTMSAKDTQNFFALSAKDDSQLQAAIRYLDSKVS